MTMTRIAVAMSGGVDSSTAAALLKDRGCDVVGFSMQLWDQSRNGSGQDEPGFGRCCSLDDIYDARTVAARLEFPYYVVNFQEEFERRVVKYFAESYREGLTPSPCVLCNSHLKFRHLMEMAEEIQATHVATGHYARIARDRDSGRHLLLRSSDARKDQSYYLFELTQDQLGKALFPLGELSKSEVREIARRHGLEVADKAESQEICFVPDGDYAAFVERYFERLEDPALERPALPPGEMVDLQGNVLGRHQGLHRYTIGQRRGLGIARPAPHYVIDILPAENRVVVGERRELGRRSCRVVRPNWISIAALDGPLRVKARIRSRHEEAPATVHPLGDGSLAVEFDLPQLAVTPGQACVFYDGDVVVGGGWIARG